MPHPDESLPLTKGARRRLRLLHPLLVLGATTFGHLSKGLRESRARGGEPAVWAFGWMPDFCYALGVAAAILVVLEWLNAPPTRRWTAVVGSLAVALFYELRELGTSRGTFDWADVAGLIAGAVAALLLDRWARQDAQATTIEPGTSTSS